MDTSNSNTLPESIGYGNFGGSDEPDAADGPQAEGSDLDKLADEMDESSSDDPLDRDLGYGGEKPEDEEENTEDSEESEDPNNEEDEQEEEGGEEESLDEEEESPEEEEDDQEDELFYDAERDFPESDVQPTKYSDRIQLNSGFTEKVRYLRELKTKLEENGSRLGAIPLPEYFGDNEDMIDDTVDRETFSSLDDDKAKKAVHDMDVSIKRAKGKLDKVQQKQKQSQQSQKATQEYDQAVDDLTNALDTIGLSVDKAKSMSIKAINKKANKAIADLEDDENANEFIESNGAKSWRKAIRQLEQAKQTVTDFPNKHKKFKDQAKSKDGEQAFDPELTKTTYKGFSDDRPDHKVFDSVAREQDFLEYARGKIQRKEITPPQHEREWLKQADSYMDMIEKEKKEYQQRKKSKQKKNKGTSKTADDSPVEKDKDKKPSPESIKNRHSRRDVITTNDIDKDLRSLAREMNQ